MIDVNPLYSLSGLAVGVLVGLTGVGGGSLMTPLLVLLFGVHPVTAVGTDLLYAAITKSVGTFAHSVGRTVDWRITGLLAAGSVPAAALTLVCLVGPGRQEPQAAALIKVALGYALLLTAAMLLARRRIVDFIRRRQTGSEVERPMRRDVLTVGVGAVLGVLVSITSVGAGALGMTALIALYPRLATHRLVASDIAHAVPLTFIGGTGYWYLGEVDFGMLGSLLLGSIPGILIGSLLAPRMPEQILRILLAIVLTIVGIRLARA